MNDDNDGNRAVAPGDVGDVDPHGRAALLLVESLMHTLLERSVISLGEAVEAVQVASLVTSELAFDQGGASAGLAKSQALLTAIGASLRIDLPRGAE